MTDLTYSVYIHTKTISLDKTFSFNVLKKKVEKIYKFIWGRRQFSKKI